MSLIDNLAARLGYAKAQAGKQAIPAEMLAIARQQHWNMPDARGPEEQIDLYAQLTWIATACDMVAQIGSQGIFQVERQSGPDDEDTSIDNHPFELLLRKPNPAQSRAEFIRDVLTWFKITGNLYLDKNTANETTPPDELWVIPSTMMEPVPDGQSYISGYKFTAPGKPPVYLPPWRILHMKTFNPFNPFVGLSAIQSLALDGWGDVHQQKWNLKLFAKDNAKLPMILAFKDMIADATWKVIQKERQEQWGGDNRSGALLLRGVGDGINVLQAGTTQKEMEFLSGRTFTKEEIFGKLAPGLASILAVNATEANSITGKSTLIEFGVWPALEQLAQKFSSDILPLYGDNLVGSFEDMRQTNRVLDLKEQEEYGKYHTVNEVRQEYYSEDPLMLEPGFELERVITVRDTVTGATIPPEEPGAPEVKLPPATSPAKAAKLELDPRGFMFAAQIGANTPYPAVPQPPPPPAPMPVQQPGQPPAQAQPAEPAPAAQAAELKAWETFATRRLGKGGRDFEPRVLPLFQAARIKAALTGAATTEDVRRVFERERETPDLIEMGQRIEAAILKATEKLG